MEKFIPYEKLSKKEKARRNKEARTMWTISPVTRKAENPKAYNRNKVKRSGGSLQDEQKTDASFLFHSFLIAALPPQQDKPLFSSGKQH